MARKRTATAAEPEQPALEQPEKETIIRRVYIGPTLPGGLLPTGKILYGTEQSIREYLAPVLERWPKAAALLVPMEKANDAQADLRAGRGICYKYAQDIIRETNEGRKTK